MATNRRDFLKSAPGALGLARMAQAQSLRPNVVFILSDDQNFDTIASFGGKVLTPNIDRLARGGVRFTRAYTVHGICTPSRYACLTGQFASRSQDPGFNNLCPPGTQSNVAFNVAVNPSTLNVASVMRQSGYATGFVGKWHTGTPKLEQCPRDGKLGDPKIEAILAGNQRRMSDYIKSCGFDYAASIYRGNLADHRLNDLRFHNQEWITKGALDFIEQNKAKPFFLQMYTTLVHSPDALPSLRGDWRQTPAGLLKQRLNVQPSRESVLERVQRAGLDVNGKSVAAATWLDDGVGAVMTKLEELGLADNTLIIYFSDNGTRGGKATCFEGGVHTPAWIYWKNRTAEGVESNKIIQNTDFGPTIFEAGGVKPPAEMKLDGQSLVPLLSGKDTKWRDAAQLEVGHTRAIVTRKWKYIALRYPESIRKAVKDGSLGRDPWHTDSTGDLHKVAVNAHPSYYEPDQLFDLETDPGEKVNLASNPKYTSVLADMKSTLKAKLAAFPRPFGEFKQ